MTNKELIDQIVEVTRFKVSLGITISKFLHYTIWIYKDSKLVEIRIQTTQRNIYIRYLKNHPYYKHRYLLPMPNLYTIRCYNRRSKRNEIIITEKVMNKILL